MRLVQFIDANGRRRVGRVSQDGDMLHVLGDTDSVRELALEANRSGTTLAALVDERASDEIVDYVAVIDEGRLLSPLDHPDPAHCFVTGTGLDPSGQRQGP